MLGASGACIVVRYHQPVLPHNSLMKNLIERAAKWLQAEQGRSGNVVERMSYVGVQFRNYLSDERDEILHNTRLKYGNAAKKVDDTIKAVRQIMVAFLRGNQGEALEKTYRLMQTMKFDQLMPGVPMYKCRENSKLYHYSKDEMFHIPFEKRHLVGNQRFSLAGIPCLYLGGSSYICWEELGRKDFSTSNYCGYSLKDSVNMFDMMLPASITNEHQIRRILLILLCSLPATRDHVFKPEYILPQSVLHSLIKRSYHNHKPFCVRYYSSHLLNGDADYFEHNFKEDALPRYVNYVFPASNSQNKGYSNELRVLFNQTDTISPMRETLVDPSHLIDAGSHDAYLDSQFGLVDSILDVKLGFQSKRQAVQFLVM